MNNQELQVLRSIVSPEQFNNIESLLNKRRSPLDYQLVYDWTTSCPDILIKPNELILAAINEELKAQGVESIFDEDGNKLFSYCDVGDEFGLTVMYYWPTEKFIVSSFINIIEALDENMIEMFVND
jgi:hypothetical protein